MTAGPQFIEVKATSLSWNASKGEFFIEVENYQEDGTLQHEARWEGTVSTIDPRGDPTTVGSVDPKDQGVSSLDPGDNDSWVPMPLPGLLTDGADPPSGTHLFRVVLTLSLRETPQDEFVLEATSPNFDVSLTIP